VYQLLWVRLLGLTFGVTVYAASSVLASFMAGLAVGSALIGKAVDRSRRPLLWYGISELLVGLSASVTPTVLRGLEHFYIWLYPLVGEDFRILTAVRFAACFLVLLVPTALMGGTFPIACKCSVTTGSFAERVRLLYGANTAGAMVGVLAAGFYLIGAVGIRASFQIAAATNIAVGAAVILWWRARGAAPVCAAAPRPSTLLDKRLLPEHGRTGNYGQF
jgi:spermidine synthase